MEERRTAYPARNFARYPDIITYMQQGQIRGHARRNAEFTKGFAGDCFVRHRHDTGHLPAFDTLPMLVVLNDSRRLHVGDLNTGSRVPLSMMMTTWGMVGPGTRSSTTRWFFISRYNDDCLKLSMKVDE